MARILIVDDHDLVREGLGRILSGEPGLEIVGEARDGLEGVEMCRRLRPDIALMDVQMPVMDGLEATREIRRRCPQTSVMIVTVYDDEDYLMEALKAGAAGYVLKHAPPSQITTAVRKALEGEFLLNRDLTTRLLLRLAREAKDTGRKMSAQEKARLHNSLTPRELEVLRLLTKGETNRDIARHLGTSFGTAKNHVQHIIAKLEVADRTQAAVKAIELGLL